MRNEYRTKAYLHKMTEKEYAALKEASRQDERPMTVIIRRALNEYIAKIRPISTN